MLYDVIIVGAGPAGVAAGIYAARKKLKALLLTKEIGGQSVVAADIENWIGEPHVSGVELAQKFKAHLLAYKKDLEIKASVEVKSVTKINCRAKSRACDFKVTTAKGEHYLTKTVIMTSGARHRRLGVSGEDKFEGRGISFCSTCDAPLFTNKIVAVIGGGNAGLEAVQDLVPYAKEIYLLEHADALKGDPVTQTAIKKEKKLKKILLNVDVKKFVGEQLITGLVYHDSQNNKEATLKLGGVFVEIGSVPNSEPVKGLVKLDARGQIIVDHATSETSEPGIFAAGDVTDERYKQNNISAGDGVTALLSAYAYLLNRGQ